MKITHVSLCGPVTDYMTYQDNLLPKYHKKMGLDVSVITSKYIWNKGKIGMDNRDVYRNEHHIKTIRLNNKNNTTIQSKFKRYHNLYETLNNENPDILFVHGVQFLDIKEVVRYIKKNPELKVYVDNHADFSNSATKWISKTILHKIIWRKTAQLIEPFTEKFYGVLPARVDFLKDIYKVPSSKVELLLMGADDEKVEEAVTKESKTNTRKRLNIKEDDLLIVTGGKIDKAKRQVLNLMNVVAKLNDSKVKLIVYGSVIPEMQEQVNRLAQNESIEYIGWINNDESYQLFSAADLVVFPGRHSVYWEQVVAMGIPMVVKYWDGTTHIDIDGNCKFLYDDTEEELALVLKNIINNKEVYNAMVEKAQSNKKNQFLYSNIAKRSIDPLNI
ncbi:glycosyltransferase family 4 protein [Aerococcus urinaeequi]|uniref:glycosyltransferase family 4 protein n=1 Tax=Aerococcus urinaeequi TaxID=51665 RepID=UPI003D6AEF5F